MFLIASDTPLYSWRYTTCTILTILMFSLVACFAVPATQRTHSGTVTSVLASPLASIPFTLLADPGPQCVYRGTPPIAVSKRRAQIRVLTQNTFGLDKDGNSNCEARATRIGQIIANASPAYDIVALQEHWNSLDFGIADCGGDQLEDAIWSTGRYGNSNNYYRQRPEGEAWQGETDGGQSIFTLHPIEFFDENEWDDIPGAFEQLQGSTFSRIKLNGTNIRIDFYNVHLLAESADNCSASCRRKQLQELRNEIILHSETSGNPVIIAGDFNIGGPPACTGNNRYADIMEMLGNPRDLWLEAHPNLNGYTADCRFNTVLQDVEACSYLERIDFMFLIQSPQLTNSTYIVVLRNASDMKLAKFTRSNGKHVSDHFGIEAILDIRERGRANTAFISLAQKCMDVSGGQTDDGTPIQLFTCNGTPAQRWTLGYDGQLRGVGGKCLTVRNSSTANSTVTELRSCTGSAAQRFMDHFHHYL